MTITREQVADLQPGDVVRLTLPAIPGLSVEGRLFEVQGVLQLCTWMPVRRTDGEPALNWLGWDLTVVSRAPRPLYVNHPRTEPVYGDIVRDGDGDAWQCKRGRWYLTGGSSPSGVEDISDCAPLTLLWDGETGQVVQ